MRTARSIELIRPFWIGAAVVALASAGAPAFDTGHHFDLTAAVLAEEGFDATAIEIAQVANWLTDYYTVSPTSRERVKSEVSQLHFDNLYRSQDVARYWGRLLGNAQNSIAEAARADDPLALLTTLGVLLHAVQDFSAHSNWVELHRREISAPYRRETWLADGAPDGAVVLTGSYPPHPSPPPDGHPEHGDYDSGLNKDSHARPMWPEAYVFAYCTTHEVVARVGAWADEARPGTWAKVKRYRLDHVTRRGLDLDLKAARNISMWVTGKGAAGHWKGSESGSAGFLSSLALQWTTAPPSVIVQQLKKNAIQERLAPGLYSDQAPPPLARGPAFAGQRTVVEIGVTYLAEKRGGGGRRIDRADKADLYSVTTVGGQRYVDRVLRGLQRYPNPWLTIHLADAAQAEIPVRLEVWDQDEVHGNNDDQCDVNPVAGKRELAFTVRVADESLHGDIQGVYNGPERPFEIAGAKADGMPVLLRGYVRVRALGNRVGDGVLAPKPAGEVAR
ncbi:MAG: hypothetical protein KBD01_00470 [Acidobacteria bacterium]|nr:hypothetical protein [Acidobacteriota bacterium]